VAEAAVFLLLPSDSMCCFLPLFFILSVNKVSSLSAVDVWPPSCSQWITVAGERHGGSGCGFFLLLLCVFIFSAMFSSVSVFSVFLLLFLTVQGLLSMTGRMVAAGGGSGVTLG